MNVHHHLPAALIAAALMLPPIAAASEAPPSDNATAETESVPASLTEKEMRQLLAGRGMGMGRPAVVHGYPGPMHVLRQAEALELDADQIAQTNALRERVHAVSRDLGGRIVEAERELDETLGETPVDRVRLRVLLGQIADLRAELRAAHIETHLEQAGVLTEAQLARMEPHSSRGGGHGHGRDRQGQHRQGDGPRAERRAMRRGERERGCNCDCEGRGNRQNREAETQD